MIFDFDDISSTQVRNKINKNLQIAGLVSDTVIEYIKSHNLYYI